MSTTRREFLGTTLAAGAAAATLPATTTWGQAIAPADPLLWEIPELKTPETTRDGDMLYRKLGKTGEKVSLIGLGGAHFFRGTEEVSTKLLRRAVDNGITFMDNCWDYGNGQAEIKMGLALKDGGGGYRKKVFLMTKLDGRTKEMANKQIEECLQHLQTDVIDLMQIHEIVRMEDPERCWAKGGAMEALFDAKKAGKIRYIGFTGHKDPAMHMHMIDVAAKNNFVFDAVQMPLSPLDAHFKSFARGVIPRLVKDQSGILAMKVLAAGQIPRNNIASAIECLHYAMTLPTSTVITGMDTEERLDQALQAAKTFKPLTPADFTTLLAKTKDAAAEGRLETFKTNINFDGTTRNPQWMG